MLNSHDKYDDKYSMKSVYSKALILLAGWAVLVGCSEGGQLNLVPTVPQRVLKADPGREFVSAADNYKSSSGNTGTGVYKIQHSVGNFNSKMSQGSSPSGYRVFHSVQGALISDEL